MAGASLELRPRAVGRRAVRRVALPAPATQGCKVLEGAHFLNLDATTETRDVTY